MKNLILIALTLISLNSIGQGMHLNDTVYYWPTSEEIIELRMLNNMLPLVLAWDKYSTECYNDSITSTVFYTYKFKECDYCFSIKEAKEEINRLNTEYGISNYFIFKRKNGCYQVENIYYRHKQPTFPDFMEWLKSKY